MMTIDHFAGRPDIFGNNPDSSMYNVPPDGDEYFDVRRHPHFNEEVYWLEREAEFWKQAAESFFWYCGGRDGCGDLDSIHDLCQHYAQWFEEEDDDE